MGDPAQTEGGVAEGWAHLEEGKLEQGGDVHVEEECGNLLQGGINT